MNAHIRKNLIIYYSLLAICVTFLLSIVTIGIYRIATGLAFNEIWSAWLPVLLLEIFAYLLAAYSIRRFFNYFFGGRAEDEISELLSKLPEHFAHLDHIVLEKKYGNIDHLIIDQNGIVLIETKSHGGTITYDKERRTLLRGNKLFPKKNPVRQIIGKTLGLKKYLQSNFDFYLPVQPIIVFSSRNVRLKLQNPLPGTNILVATKDNLMNSILNRNSFVMNLKKVEEYKKHFEKLQSD